MNQMQKTKNNYDKYFFKLMKNSVFGKTIKSMKKPLNL